jgi:hypothetical protein
MPMLTVVQQINQVLSRPGTKAYKDAKEVVERSTTATVAQAVEDSGIYASLPPNSSDVAEARLVFPKLTPSVNASILSALRNAFERGAAISVGWIELDGGPMVAHVHETTNGDRVVIQLSCPSGAILRNQTP